jgi:hypothetical protein
MKIFIGLLYLGDLSQDFPIILQRKGGILNAPVNRSFLTRFEGFGRHNVYAGIRAVIGMG